jgi:hypothetical protein
MTTKDEALRMAIEWLDNQQLGYSGHSVRKACQEALEPTVAELNDEYLRDTHVEGLSTNSKANEIIKTQHWLCLDGQMVVAQLYTTPPSREWQSLSDEEIEELYGDCSIEYFRDIEMHLKEKNG